MKKLLLLLTFITNNVFAQQSVQVFWPFSLGANQATMIRTMIDNANKNQNKYQFILINKQGAGGTLAASSTLTSTKLAILANTSSFYLTPLLSKEAYDVDQFTVLARMCVDRPLVLFSKNISKLSASEITISVTPNTIQALLPMTIQSVVPNFKYLEVPFKIGTDGTVAMMSGVVDASVDWLGSSSNIITPTNGVKVVGITGIKSINNFQLLPGTENLVADIFLFLPKNVDQYIQLELHQIFQDSLNDQTEIHCKNDFGRQVKTDSSVTNKIHLDNKNKWKKLTSRVLPQ